MKDYIRPYKDASQMRELICSWIYAAKTLAAQKTSDTTGCTSAMYTVYIGCIAGALDITIDECKILVDTTSKDDILTQNIIALKE